MFKIGDKVKAIDNKKLKEDYGNYMLDDGICAGEDYEVVEINAPSYSVPTIQVNGGKYWHDQTNFTKL